MPSQPPAASAWDSQLAHPPRPADSRNETARISRTESARVGRTVSIKGEVTGDEDLYIDGEVEGSIELRSHSLTIGPNGRIHANIQAREVVVFGRVEGNVQGSERVELKNSSTLNGDIHTQRIVIEDGAFLKGSIDIQKAESQPAVRREITGLNGSASNSGIVAQTSSRDDKKA